MRHDLKLHFSGQVEFVENIGIGLAWKRADHLGNAPGLEQGGQADFTVAGIVADDGQVASARSDHAIYQLRRHPGSAEATDHDDRTIGNAVQCGSDGFKCFIDQGVLLFLFG
ncbi:hypothetical protein D3C81_1840720 [compost metagenome]